MSDVLSDADKWLLKAKFMSTQTIDFVQSKQEEQRKALEERSGRKEEAFRGYEYYWYGTWNCLLVALCTPTMTLATHPQRVISNPARNNDGKLVKRWLIPDFTILRIEGTPTLHRPHQPMAGRDPSGTPQSHRPIQHFNDQSHICKETVVLVEIKAFPDETDANTIWLGLMDAYEDLLEQIRLLFKKKTWKDRPVKAVIGIWAAGTYWRWKTFAPEDLEGELASENADSTYRDPSGSEVSEEIPASEQGSDDFLGVAPPGENDGDQASPIRLGSEPSQDCGEPTTPNEDEAESSSDRPEGDGEHHEEEVQGTSEGEASEADQSQGGEPGEDEVQDEEVPVFFCLGSEESDDELRAMVQAIFELPGSEKFTMQ